MAYAHSFKAGDLVENGSARARVISRVEDDALEVLYEGDDEPTVELALYFRRIEYGEGRWG